MWTGFVLYVESQQSCDVIWHHKDTKNCNKTKCYGAEPYRVGESGKSFYNYDKLPQFADSTVQHGL